ncbi:MULTISPECIES: hypothetical protein [unclassified Lentimonas]|uniref:hypothetical protein n=1 Tax=unclassified Lentimonas TaxID=2630993 RepID=UPI0013206143|nr:MULTISPECIES: hypothetical protein [unclassified Lentimonas]CAA6679595.1 Unannotated [Lentimonas sp. CC4]CAA6687313.1 Unannotated [Lentimonas sp. CC6]CAA7077208.1 Unannotated [Lentimonas sp. CC4]CAA7171773.1 Unannotated [Lentimonas sp. CC21]CAA7183418.1 Unannotated [Lentimonas sp. CC8]
MSLSDSQKTTVSTWISEGKSLADVQRLLREEFSISMTYMDVRFLVDDLDIVFAEPEPEASEEDKVEDAEVVDPEVSGAVMVDVDAIPRPGALVNGSVVFSDGVKLGWQLSSAGQLGLIPGDDPTYRPNPEDVQDFQTQLQEILQQKGY